MATPCCLNSCEDAAADNECGPRHTACSGALSHRSYPKAEDFAPIFRGDYNRNLRPMEWGPMAGT
jgi:hypothetical protein